MSFFELLRGLVHAKASDKTSRRLSFRPGAEELESRLTPAIKITPTTALITTEKLGAATFTAVLTTRPVGTVLINMRTSDQTEGSVSPTALIFNPTNWNMPKTVTVRGVNDFVDDGNIPYQIILDPAQAPSDPSYNGVDPPDVALVNRDDDTAGMLVNPTSGLIINEGGIKWITVRLTSQPIADVTIPIYGDADADVSPTPLVFTPADWNAPKTFSITGIADGFGNEAQDETHVIWAGPAVSTDPLYAGMARAVKVTIHEPRAPTMMTLTSSVNPSTRGQRVVFTATIATPEGSNLVVRNGTVTFFIDGVPKPALITNGQARYATSTLAVGRHTIRAVYNGNTQRFLGSKASLIQIVQRPPGITVTPLRALVTTEGGGTTAFNIKLNSPPTADVTIGIASSDSTEGKVSVNSASFTPVNWNVAQKVIVTGLNDSVVDGDINYRIIFAPAISADPRYNGRKAANLTVVNRDNDVPPRPINATGTWRGTATISDSACDYWGTMTLRLQGNNFNAISTGTITLDLVLINEKIPGFCPPTRTGQDSVVATATTARFVFSVSGTLFQGEGVISGNRMYGTLSNISGGVVQTGTFNLTKL